MKKNRAEQKKSNKQHIQSLKAKKLNKGIQTHQKVAQKAIKLLNLMNIIEDP